MAHKRFRKTVADRPAADRSRAAGRPPSGARMLCVVLAAVSLLLIGSGKEELARRRQRIERMTPEAKAELARKQERFAKLPPERQDRLRRLHECLEAQPDREALREVMRSYCDWLDTLPDYVGYELTKLPVQKRMEQIKRRRFGYGPRNARALREWWLSYVKQLDPSSRNPLQRRLFGSAGPRSRGRFGWLLRPDAVQFLQKQAKLDSADLSPLRDQLSKATAERFDKMSPEKQRKWVAGYVVHILRRQMRSRFRGRQPVQVSDEQLAEFFESALSAEDRDWLLRQPGNKMHEQLRRLYQAEHFPRPQRAKPGHARRDRQTSFPRPGSPVKPRHPPADRKGRQDLRRPGFSGPNASSD